MSKYDYSLEDLSDISPFENYTSAIRDKSTRKKYAGQLEMFLNPDYDWIKSQQKRKLLSEKKFTILVNVIDSGPGIPEDDMEKIFELLFTSKLTGTGLGLNICKSIIEQHKGKIYVANNPTTFTIELPKA